MFLASLLMLPSISLIVGPLGPIPEVQQKPWVDRWTCGYVLEYCMP